MKKVNVSTDQMGRFEGKWVAIDTKRNKITVVGDTLKDICPLIGGKKGEEKKIKASAFLVPNRDETKYLVPTPLFL